MVTMIIVESPVCYYIKTMYIGRIFIYKHLNQRLLTKTTVSVNSYPDFQDFLTFCKFKVFKISILCDYERCTPFYFSGIKEATLGLISFQINFKVISFQKTSGPFVEKETRFIQNLAVRKQSSKITKRLPSFPYLCGNYSTLHRVGSHISWSTRQLRVDPTYLTSRCGYSKELTVRKVYNGGLTEDQPAMRRLVRRVT